MTVVTAPDIAGGSEAGFASLFVAGLKWAGEALRALKTAAREGRLTDETSVRRIAMHADACQAGHL